MIRDARKWEVDPKRMALEFDAAYYRGLLEKAWGEAAFVFRQYFKKCRLKHNKFGSSTGKIVKSLPEILIDQARTG